MTYTIDQIRQAVQSAKAAGDVEAANQLATVAAQMAMASAPRDEYNPTDGTGTLQRLREGIGQGMTNVVRHGGNMLGLVSDEQLADAKRLDAPLLDTGAGMAGSLIGETAALAVPGAGTTGLAMKVAPSLARTAVRRGALEGAAQGALMADPGAGSEGAAFGAGAGALLPAAFRGGSRLARGVERTPEAQALMDRGVDLTPGQMNPGGVFNQLEESWQSMPVLGPVITGSRDSARRQYQQAIVREGAAPGAVIPDGDIDEMLDAAYKSFAPLYDQAKGFPVRPYIINTAGKDQPLATLFRQTVNSRSIPATDEARKRAMGILQNELSSGVGTSDDLLRIRSNIRAEAREASKSPESLQRDTAALLESAESQITKALESQLPADALAALRTADSKYGTYKIIEGAVAAAKDQPGGFSPAQLSTAIKKATDASSYARGAGGPLRDLASQGRNVFDVRSPPTGQRLAAIGLPGAVGLSNPGIGIPAAAAFLGLTGTRAGRRIASGQTAPQQAVARQIGLLESMNPTTRNVSERYLRGLLSATTNE